MLSGRHWSAAQTEHRLGLHAPSPVAIRTENLIPKVSVRCSIPTGVVNQLFGSKRPCLGVAAGLTEIKCFPSPSVAGVTISKRRNCLFRLKKPIRPVPALPAYAYQEASSLVLALILASPAQAFNFDQFPPWTTGFHAMTHGPGRLGVCDSCQITF